MGKKKSGGWFTIAAAAALLAFYWLFPQTLFDGCIRAVPQQTERRQEEEMLTEEQKVCLFDLRTSNYKIICKIAQNN